VSAICVLINYEQIKLEAPLLESCPAMSVCPKSVCNYIT
jgi:hypothetical protein